MINGAEKRLAGVRFKEKAGSRSIHRIELLNTIFQTACRPDDGNRSVLEAI